MSTRKNESPASRPRAAAAAGAAGAGYSGTPLAAKLGIKPGMAVVLQKAPPGAAALLEPLPAAARIATRLASANEMVILFCADAASLSAALPGVAAKLVADGTLWIAWPKKSSPLFRDLSEDGIRAVVLPTGLVDVKVCAIDSDWSGLKLMVRKERRPGWPGAGAAGGPATKGKK